MFLSRLILNPRSPAVHRDLADCQRVHQRVLSGFPDGEAGEEGAREQFGVLYRVEAFRQENPITLLVQSCVEPDWSRLPPGYLEAPEGGFVNPAIRPLDPAYARLHEGMVLRFRLCANPTRKIDTKTGPDGRRRHGRRVELRRESDQLAWLARKGAEAGFEVLGARVLGPVPDVRTVPEATVGWKKARAESGEDGGGRLTFGSVLFEGRLRVLDADKLRGALGRGIGPAKAYGHGLLSVATESGDEDSGPSRIAEVP